MASRGNIGRTLNDMIGAPAGDTTPKVIFKSEDGILLCYGKTVPSDTDAGYAPGCLFIHIDGSEYNTVLYCNIGSVTSADFNVVTMAS